MPLFANDDDPVRSHLKKIGSCFTAGNEPKSILVISAHYETSPAILVTSSDKPGMHFDYNGMPPKAYEFKYPASGDPELASRVKALLSTNGISCDLDPDRGFDHGAFVPLMIAFPKANIPVVVLSLHTSLDPEMHIKIGEALQPLREEDVLVVGSGMSFHDEAAMRAAKTTLGYEFDQALVEVITKKSEKRNDVLKKWDTLPGAKEAHKREEHLLPLLVILGIAGDSPCEADSFVAYNSYLSGFSFA